MPDSKELNRIKKKYGENFMKLCRDLFPTILEMSGRLEEILSMSFAGNTRTLYEDIVSNGLEGKFKNYIYSKIDVEDPEKKIIMDKTPYELLDEAGYVLTECFSEDEIQKFRKYYAPKEELCTFNGGRLKRNIVFFAVKKNANDIKRENFKKPEREDEYGTSVMGIQFNREGLCTVSIKNRYNHTVNNPDATYGNDLDRITPGLTQSFARLLKKDYDLELNDANVEKFTIPNYVVANDGKYYRYNTEIEGIYYCPGNVIIENGSAKKIENPESQMLIDYFILDMKNKSIDLYDPRIDDSFVNGLRDLSMANFQIERTENGGKKITIQKRQKDPIIIGIDKDNRIIEYVNHELKNVEDNFLVHNTNLCNLDIPNVIQIGQNFLYNNKGLKNLELSKLTSVGDAFLARNVILKEINCPNLKNVGFAFLLENEDLNSLNLPSLEKVEANFLSSNRKLNNLHAPNLKQVGDFFLFNNEELLKLNLPNLSEVGDHFLINNESLREFEAKNLKKVGLAFLGYNENLRKLVLPNLQSMDILFLPNNQDLTYLDMPYFPKVSDKLSKLIEENKKVVDSKNIAVLDKNSNLTSSEITAAKMVIKEEKNDILNKTSKMQQYGD